MGGNIRDGGAPGLSSVMQRPAPHESGVSFDDFLKTGAFQHQANSAWAGLQGLADKIGYTGPIRSEIPRTGDTRQITSEAENGTTTHYTNDIPPSEGGGINSDFLSAIRKTGNTFVDKRPNGEGQWSLDRYDGKKYLGNIDQAHQGGASFLDKYAPLLVAGGAGAVLAPIAFGAAAGAGGLGGGGAMSAEAASAAAGTSDIGIGAAAAGSGGSGAAAGIGGAGAAGLGDTAPAVFNAAADSQAASLAAGYNPASMGAGMTNAATAGALTEAGAGLSSAAPTTFNAAADSQAASLAAGYNPATMGAGITNAATAGSLTSGGLSGLGGWGDLAIKVGGTLIGGVLQKKSADAAGDAASGAVARATAASQEQLAFIKQQVAAQGPGIAKLGAAADSANTQDQQIAAAAAARSATAWQQNQQATQGSVGQMGLNALGAQYLNADQTQQLIALQGQLANGTPEQKAQAQAQIAVLQKTAETAGMGLEKAKADAITGTTAAQAAQVKQAYGVNAAATKQVGADTAAGLSSVAATTGDKLSALGASTGQTAVDNANATAGQQIGLGDAMARSAVGDAGTVSDRELAIGKEDAASTLADAGTTAAQLNATGDARRADQIGFFGGQAQTQRDVARQRADANELRATTQANADIANSADQSQRQLLRLGGDPNRLAAMSAEIAQKQQLARIASGNQVAGTNIANLNSADDAARALETTGFAQGTGQQYQSQNQAQMVKSSALDRARAILTQTKQGALGTTAAGLSEARGARSSAGAAAIGTNAAGMETARTAKLGGDQSAIALGNTAANQGVAAVAGANQLSADKTLAGSTAAQGVEFAGLNQATAINNAAKDKVDANLNSLQAGTANYGAGFANTASQADQTATYAGATGVAGLNTAAQSTVPMTNAVNGAYGNAVAASGVGNAASGNILNSGSSGAAAVSGTAAAISGAAGPLINAGIDYFKSTKKAKEGRQPVDAEGALAGLEQALPQSYRYKQGMGPPGRKIGAMAEDMHAAFGDETAPGGKVISVQNSIGLQHAAIVALSRKVKKLESKRA